MADYTESKNETKKPSSAGSQYLGKEPEEVLVSADYESTLEEIPERQLTWIQAALLLLTEYVVLAILAFPSSFAVLGMAGGTIATLVVGLATLWTSKELWKYCMAHPQIRDICDAAFFLAGGTGKKARWAWWIAFVGLAANNYCIMGLHVNAGATAIQTIRGGKECTLIWACVLGVIMFLGSIIRDFKHMSAIGLIASSTMLVCTLIVLCGHGVQGTPNGWAPGDVVTWTVWAPEGTTFVAGVNAVLNMSWVGQALIPSFIGDMKNPQDFPKALYVSMAAEFCLFTITGAVVYSYAGSQFTTAPAYGTLIEKYGKIAAGFTLPTIIIVGILYSLVTSRAIFFQIFHEGSIHRLKHTTTGWSVWILVVFIGWVISFIIGEAVPFFNDLLSLISALFDSWFGMILWGLSWYELNRGRRLAGPFQIWENFLAALMIVAGLFFFGAGTYTSVQSILDSYSTGSIKKPFTCVNSGFTFTR